MKIKDFSQLNENKMTPDKLKTIFNKFRNSELEYNRNKGKLSNAYKEILRQFAKDENWEEFDVCVFDALRDLGDAFNFAITSIETLYNRPK